MSWYRVLDVSFPEVPDFDGIVGASGDDMVTVRAPVDPHDALEVTLQEHDALTSPKVPNSPKRVHPTGSR